MVSFSGEVLGVKRLAAGTMPRDAEYEVQLRKGENTLMMLRLMLHYGAPRTPIFGARTHDSAQTPNTGALRPGSFSTAVAGPGKTTVLREFESASDFTAGLWKPDGSGALSGVPQRASALQGPPPPKTDNSTLISSDDATVVQMNTDDFDADDDEQHQQRLAYYDQGGYDKDVSVVEGNIEKRRPWPVKHDDDDDDNDKRRGITSPAAPQTQNLFQMELYPVFWAVHGANASAFAANGSINIAQYGIKNHSFTVCGSMLGSSMPTLSSDGKTPKINGGVPQAANLKVFLDSLATSIEATIPATGYAGLAVFDFEAYAPLWSEDTGAGGWHGKAYRVYSVKLVQDANPSWSKAQAEAEAQTQFEAAAIKLFVAALQKGKAMRPHAQWGFYGMPYVHGSSNSSKLLPIWKASDVLFPSIYLSEPATAAQLVQETVELSVAMAAEAAAGGSAGQIRKQVYPFAWECWHNGSTLLDREDAITDLLTPYNHGADGLVIWGDAGSGCHKGLSCMCDPDHGGPTNPTYFENIQQQTGPLIKDFEARVAACSVQHCSGHGRCTYVPETKPPPSADAAVAALCTCFEGFSGPACAGNDAASNFNGDRSPLKSENYITAGSMKTDDVSRPWPDTTDGIHTFLSFDYYMTDAEVAANGSRYDFIRGANPQTKDTFRRANPDVVLSAYIPFTRDMHSAHNLSWWQTHQPSWVVYQCDRTTPTYEFGDVNVPLDIGNPEVVAYQLNYTAEMKAEGFDVISFDNFGTDNNFKACGTYAPNGSWVQKWNGTRDDPTYTATVLWWLERFSQGIHTQGLKLMPNFMLGGLHWDDPLVLRIGNLTDGILSEGGFTDNAERLLLTERWEDIIHFMINLQAHGKAYWSIDEWGCAGTCAGGHTVATLAEKLASTDNISTTVREFVIASYLMGKGAAAGVYMVCNQCYGLGAYFEEYNASIGRPLAAASKRANGVWERAYSGGRVIVYPADTESSVHVSLAGRKYKSVYGRPIAGDTVELKNGTGLVLLFDKTDEGMDEQRTAPSDFTLSTPHMSLTVDHKGVVTAVTDKAGGRNLVSPGHTLISVTFTGTGTGKPTPPTRVEFEETKGLITAYFPNQVVIPVSVKLEDDVLVMVVLAAGANVTGLSAITFCATPVQLASAAAEAVAAFDSQFALVVLPMNLHTYTELTDATTTPRQQRCNGSTGVVLAARITAEVGFFANRGASLWGGPAADLDAAIAAGEKRFGLPSPMIDGVWSKRAPDVHKGYFLICPGSLDTLNDTIKYVVESGLKYMMLVAPCIWEGGGMAGHYNFSQKAWGGMAGMKKAVAQINAAGLKAGMHTMSGNIGKNDAYVQPVPDPRLAKTDLNTLATAITATDVFLPLAKAPAGFPVPYGSLSPRAGTDVIIGSEIIHYYSVNTTAPWGLIKVTRGAYNTTAAAHAAGAKISLLLQMYEGFLPDPSTDMIDEIAANMARAYNEAGMAMLSFDGIEAHSVTGPPGIAEAMLHQAFFNHLEREALVDSSASGGFLWHLNTRQGQVDWAAIDRRAYFDFTRGPYMAESKCESLDIPDAGWWGFLLYEPGSFYSTTPDELEYMASRAVGWGASPGIETSPEKLNANGRAMEGLRRMKPWLSLGERLSPEVKATLTAINVDYTLEAGAHAHAGQYFIRPGRAHNPAVADPQVNRSLKWTVDNAFASSGRMGVRLRALSALPAIGNTTDLLGLSKGSKSVRDSECAHWDALLNPTHRGLMDFAVVTGTDVPAAGPRTEALKLNMSNTSKLGIGCFRSRFPSLVNLSSSKVLEFEIYGDGSGAVLDVCLEDADANYREFIVDINFTGWRTIRPSFPDARRLYTHAGGQENHNYKMSMRSFWVRLHLFTDALDFATPSKYINGTGY